MVTTINNIGIPNIKKYKNVKAVRCHPLLKIELLFTAVVGSPQVTYSKCSTG